MTVATNLLFLIGILGATDIALFHTVSHGIRHHTDSRTELIHHSLRGPTYATLFLLVPNFALEGAWFWLLIFVFVFDLAISIWDFSIEKESRRVLGGLPSDEYVLHIILAMIFGAFVTSVALEAGSWSLLPTQIAYRPVEVPDILRLVLAIMAALVLYSGLTDLMAASRLGRQETQT